MSLNYGFAGDRDISVKVLDFLLEHDYRPSCLFISDSLQASHAEQLISRCPFLPSDRIILGSDLKKEETISRLSVLDLDYLICIHYPFIISSSILSIPKIGVLNLHPAFLPWNRGWHTPTWAIYDRTPFGATLHFMDNSLDTGDIVHQKELTIAPEDTADSLYQKVLDLEKEVFIEAFPALVGKTFSRMSQKEKKGSIHRKNDIREIQMIDLQAFVRVNDFLSKLRALTTNSLDEAAFFEEDGKVYRVQVKIVRWDKE